MGDRPGRAQYGVYPTIAGRVDEVDELLAPRLAC